MANGDTAIIPVGGKQRLARLMSTASEYFMRTDRLGFRHWRAGDLGLALGLWGDPKVTAFIDARGGLSPEQVRERLSREVRTQEAHGVQYWPVFLLASREHVGCCGLRPYRADRRVFELGFHIRSSHWRRGFAAEAAAAAIRYAFESRGARGLFAGHHPDHAASKKLLEKLGFRYTHHEPYAPTGLRHPSYFLKQEDYQRDSRHE